MDRKIGAAQSTNHILGGLLIHQTRKNLDFLTDQDGSCHTDRFAALNPVCSPGTTSYILTSDAASLASLTSCHTALFYDVN